MCNLMKTRTLLVLDREKLSARGKLLQQGSDFFLQEHWVAVGRKAFLLQLTLLVSQLPELEY